MTPSRLSALDAAFLSLERDHAPMHVGWAALFSPRADASRPSFEEVRAHIESRLHLAPRYRQRLAGVPFGLGDPVWVDETEFDISHHVRRSEHGNFGRLVDDVLSTPSSTGARCGSCGSPRRPTTDASAWSARHTTVSSMASRPSS